MILASFANWTFAQWPSSPDSAVFLGGYAEYKQALPDLHGGAYILWGTTQTNCARINRMGEVVWIEEQCLDSNLGDEVFHQSIALSSDSCLLISYKTACYTVPPELGNAEVRVQKIDSLGNKLWDDGVIITPENVTGAGLRVNSIISKVSETTDGGAYVVWSDFSRSSRLMPDLYVQRLDDLGQVVWADSGIEVCQEVLIVNEAKTNYCGDLQIAYRRQESESSTLLIQRYGPSGINRYDSLGVSFPSQNIEAIVFDSTGLIYGATNSTLFGLDTNGLDLWSIGRVFSNGIERTLELLVDETGGIIFLGQDIRGVRKTIVHYLDTDGIQRLGSDGLELFDGWAGDSRIVADTDGFIITREADTHFAIKIDYSGNYLWADTTVIYWQAQVGAGRPLAVSDSEGGLIYFFMENFNLLVSHVNSDGTLGNFVSVNPALRVAPPSHQLISVFPNPFNPITTLQYELASSSEASLIVYDIAGREVTTLISNDQTEGTHSATWNGTDQCKLSKPPELNEM